jgi:beta-phosphoglucomutase
VAHAILWDMDGVVTDSGEAHFLAWQALYAEQGESITYETFAATFGMSNMPILKAWRGEHTPPEELRALSQRKEELFRALAREHAHLLPGVERWLARAQELGLRQVIASSAPMANIVAVLGALGVDDYFDALISGANLPASKPDPTIFLYAAAAVGATPRESVVIEDGIVGVEAARRAGMRCIGVTTTHPAAKLAGADLIIADLTGLEEEALRRLLG